jgi:hypothetical protein
MFAVTNGGGIIHNSQQTRSEKVTCSKLLRDLSLELARGCMGIRQASNLPRIIAVKVKSSSHTSDKNGCKSCMENT